MIEVDRGSLAATVRDATADLFEQQSRAIRGAGIGIANQCRYQHVLKHRALRQQAMVLQHEADIAIAKRGERIG